MPMDTMEEINMKEVERKPYSSESVRVRCPQCRKLYMVQFSDIKEAKPRFECIQCHSRFWLSLPDMDLSTELTGIPVQVKNPPPRAKTPGNRVDASKETEPCPKCFKPIQARSAECPHCGVVVAKVKELNFTETTPPAHSENVSAAWKKVLSNYGDESMHSDFLRIAQRERAIPYAAAVYGQMNKLMPTDEGTKKRVREVQALGSVMLTASENKVKSRPYARVWQVPLLAATMLMVVGAFLPVFRNMVGVGAAILFVAIALQIQVRRR